MGACAVTLCLAVVDWKGHADADRQEHDEDAGDEAENPNCAPVARTDQRFCQDQMATSTAKTSGPPAQTYSTRLHATWLLVEDGMRL